MVGWGSWVELAGSCQEIYLIVEGVGEGLDGIENVMDGACFEMSIR